MAVAIFFTPTFMNTEQYDECLRRLEAVGAGAPAGRLSHVCFESGGTLRIFDVWDSAESFEEFGRALLPILEELGVKAGTTAVGEVHRIIEG
ncbi:MAG: hypothetical protein MOB07_26020 [Acidobacteria bacterium]|nr:hypothetical protein [Acidobacteriota bacterium]